jgi:WD40 repeat protein
MKLLHTIDTNPNPNALCALSPSSENCFLAYPSNSSGSCGELLIFDATHLQPICIIQAHKSPLSCVSFSFDGSRVATSSDKVPLFLYKRVQREQSFVCFLYLMDKNCINLEEGLILLAFIPFHSI